MERTEKRESVEVASHEQLLLIEPSPLEEAWENALTVLDRQLGPEVTASWLTPLQPVSFEEGTLTYRAPTKFIANWVESRYLDRLREAWTAVGYDVNNIAIATVLKKSAA